MNDFKVMILYFAIGLCISFFISPIVIPFLQRLKFGQEIRREGPKSHLKKAGTPTMGGFIFIFSITAACLVYSKYDINILYLLSYVILFGLVGFIDDYNKIAYKRNLGITAKQKILLQIVISCILAIIQYKINNKSTYMYLPFFPVVIDLGFFYIPFLILTMTATTNAVNLTDGLDGLAAGVTSITAFTLGIIAYKFGYISSAVFGLIVSGACVGFLRVNRHPAKCFMGDTGSMALGGAVSGIAISINMPLIIILVGMVYLIEALSVIMQVAYYKKTGGKRFFKMSPFHHHLELSGWSETKVVKFFYIFTLLFSLIGYFSTLFM